MVAGMLALATVVALGVVILRALDSPHAARRRRMVLRRLIAQSGILRAYSFARARRWPEASDLRRMLRGPLHTAEVDAEYERLVFGVRGAFTAAQRVELRSALAGGLDPVEVELWITRAERAEVEFPEALAAANKFSEHALRVS